MAILSLEKNTFLVDSMLLAFMPILGIKPCTSMFFKLDLLVK